MDRGLQRGVAAKAISSSVRVVLAASLRSASRMMLCGLLTGHALRSGLLRAISRRWSISSSERDCGEPARAAARACWRWAFSARVSSRVSCCGLASASIVVICLARVDLRNCSSSSSSSSVRSANGLSIFSCCLGSERDASGEIGCGLMRAHALDRFIAVGFERREQLCDDAFAELAACAARTASRIA